MSDWYLERQLTYFKAGIRGSHPDDIYGDQMNLGRATCSLLTTRSRTSSPTSIRCAKQATLQ